MEKTNQIENLRRKHKMSQEKLASELNVSRQTVSEWERGIAYPSVEKLLALSKIFNVSLDYIITGKEYEKNSISIKTKNTKNPISIFIDDKKSEKENTKNCNKYYKYSSLKNTDTYVFGTDKGNFVSTKDEEKIGNTIAIGCAGTGKNMNLILPNMFQAIKRKESVFIVDAAGHMYSQTASIFSEAGYNIKAISFYEDFLLKWNPLLEISENKTAREREIRLIYNSLFLNKKENTDMYMEDLCFELFKTITFLIIDNPDRRTENKSLKDVYNMLINFDVKKLCAMLKVSLVGNNVLEDLNREPFLTELMEAVKLLVFKFRNIFQYSSTQEILSGNEFMLDELFNKKTIVYLIPSIFDVTLTPLYSLFINMFILKTIKNNEDKSKNNISVFLDEFQLYCNDLCFINNLLFNKKIKNANTTISFQITKQLQKPKDVVEEYISLFDNFVMLGTVSYEDSQLFSHILEEDIDEIKYTSNCYMYVKRNDKVILVKKEFPKLDAERKKLKDFRKDFF